MLLVECIRRLSKNGKHKVSITNAQLSRLVEGNHEVDFSESNEVRFILKFGETSEEELFLNENIILPREVLIEKDESVSS